MIGQAVGGQCGGSSFQGGHRGDEAGVLNCGIRKAHDPDMAAGTDLVRSAARRLSDDINKRIHADLQVGERLSRHAAGAVEDEHNVGRIAYDIGCRRNANGHIQSAVAGNGGNTADRFTGTDNAHIFQYLFYFDLSISALYQYIPNTSICT